MRERVPQHRAQRRDAGAAGDEHEAPLLGIRRKRERAERPFDVDQLRRARASRCGPGAPSASTPTSSSRQPSRRASSGAAGNRVRAALVGAVRRHEHRLAGGVGERRGRRDRSGRCARAASRRCTSRMGSVSSTADYAIPRMALRRVRGAMLRLVRRRRLGDARRAGAGASGRLGRVQRRAVIYDAWWVDGLALVVGATGLALFWTGLTGRQPGLGGRWALGTWKLELGTRTENPRTLESGASRASARDADRRSLEIDALATRLRRRGAPAARRPAPRACGASCRDTCGCRPWRAASRRCRRRAGRSTRRC